MTAKTPRGGHVNTTGTRRGRDGRLYRSAPMTRRERSAAIRLSHRLVCQDGLSIRAAQARMAEAGIRRSVGIIARDLADFECPACADVDT